MLLFDPQLHISPFELFRLLKSCRGARFRVSPRIFDLRSRPEGPRLAGSEPWPGCGGEPPSEGELVLVDEDGEEALAAARRLRQAGYPRVRALYGGLRLYDFALDPRVVGEDRFLE